MSFARIIRRTASACAATAVALLSTIPLANAAAPMLVKNFGVDPPTIDTSGGIGTSAGFNDTRAPTHGGSLAYFVANGLWRSDGTPAGTFKLTSFANATAYEPTYINGTVFFSYDDGIHGYEPWRTDGTVEGTVMVADINPGPPYSSPSGFVYANGVVYFTAADPSGVHLWKTDGTTAGTSEVKDVVAQNMTAAGRTLFFNVGAALWMSDGTTPGTVAVKSFTDPPSHLAPVGERLFFIVHRSASSDDELWTSDGTSSGTIRLNTFSTINTTNNTFGEFHGLLFFRATVDGDLSYWRSDGTVTGTVKLTDVPFDFEVSQNVSSVTMNGVFYYEGHDKAHGWELFRTHDGTAANAALVKDINPGGHDSYPHELVNANGTLYFFASDASNREGLWRSDGTAAGTVKLHQFESPSSECLGSCLKRMAPAGSSVVFGANDLVHGAEPWGSDGTVAGTQLLYDYQTVDYELPSIQIVDAGGTAMALVASSPSSDGLWRTDGTGAGNVLLKSFANAGGSTITAGGRTYFIVPPPPAGDPFHLMGCQLWKTDGTAGGTMQLSDIDPCGGSRTADGVPFAAVGNTIYVSALESGAWGLWRSDGTPGGTMLVTTTGARIDRMAATASLVFFIDGTNVNDTRLWKSDGTAAGTVAIGGSYEMVPDSDPNDSSLLEITAAGSHAFFNTNSSTCPKCRYLTASDGTSAQVISGDIHANVEPESSAALGGTLFFSRSPGGGFWRSDGTSAGTYLVKDMLAGDFTNAGGTLFFVGSDGGASGLWTSDGTAAATIPVPSSPSYFEVNGPLTHLGGVVFFFAGDSPDDLATWRSDGTAAGTGPVPGLVTIPGLSPTAVGPDLFFIAAVKPSRDMGLWVVPDAALCGDGVLDAGEQCDDGNELNTDGCTNACAFNVCGDGLINVGVEDCDDGNTANGDCCSATCHFEPATTTCGPGVPPCGADQCDGSGTCLLVPVNAGTTCRDSISSCDVPDACDGVQVFCPVADAVVSGGTVCRPSAGVCDVTEYCDGFTPTCAVDAFEGADVACRPPDGPCDPGGWCTGSDADCPNFVPCQQALTQKAKLAIKDDVDPSKRALSWQWKSSGPVTVADLGNPTAATDYTICVIDQTGGPNTVELYATAPANGFCAGKPCWAFKGNAYKYKDKDLTPDGLMSVQAKAGDAGKASFKVKGKGANLALAGLPLTTPVTVRLLRSDAPACWEATFSSSLLNTSAAFKATGD